MSAAISQPDSTDTGATGGLPGSAAQGTVVVRRNAGLDALVGAGASAIAIAYLWRASLSAAPLDWALCAVMAAVGALYLAHLVDARTPLLVADDLGVRVRLGNHWRGLPWDAVDRVVVQPRRGLLKDGRLMFAPHSLARALDGLDSRGRRAAALNQRLYGAALAVPMGLTTLPRTGRTSRTTSRPSPRGVPMSSSQPRRSPRLLRARRSLPEHPRAGRGVPARRRGRARGLVRALVRALVRGRAGPGRDRQRAR